MPDIDYSVALGAMAQSSTGIIKPDNKKLSKGKELNENALLDNATSKDPVPVVASVKAPVADFLITEQSTRQLYVIQARTDINGKVTEVYLAREDENGIMTGVDWCSAEYVTCGSLADASITVPGKEPVQNNPETTPTTKNAKPEKKESYVFFDPYLFANRSDIIHDDGTRTPHPDNGKIANHEMECAIGIQRGVAQYMGKYDGKKKISNDVQNTINKWVHLIPFSSIPDSDYPDIKYKNCIDDRSLDGTVETFFNFWNNNIATENVEVVVFWMHANPNLLDIRDDKNEYITTQNVSRMTMPDMNYFLLL